MKCENCNEIATIFLTEIQEGKQINRDLCKQCATRSAGMSIDGNAPISEVLTKFVLAHCGLQEETDALTKPESEIPADSAGHKTRDNAI